MRSVVPRTSPVGTMILDGPNSVRSAKKNRRRDPNSGYEPEFPPEPSPESISTPQSMYR